MTTQAQTLTDGRVAFAVARHVARKRAPYLSRLLHAIPCYADERVPTLAVATLPEGARLIIYSPAFVASLTPAVAATALLHEIAHVYLRHADRIGARDPKRYNVACDIALHEQFQAAGWPLGADWLTAQSMNLPRGLSADQYYDLLPAGGGQSKGKGGPGEGTECGSGATGSAAPGEADVVAQAVAEGYGAGQSKADVDRARATSARALKDAKGSKGVGTIPGGWDVVADEILADLAEPKVPWERVLRSYVQRAVRVSVGTGSRRYTTPSRFQSALGHGPGRPILAGHRRPQPEVTVVVDTSGSMGQAEYQAVLAELDAILSSTGGRVTLYAVDAAVQTCGVVRSIAQALPALRGGGGTSFDPAFREIAKGKGQPDLLVYFTDGYGSVSLPQPSFPVVWVTTGAKAFPWGDVIAVNETP